MKKYYYPEYQKNYQKRYRTSNKERLANLQREYLRKLRIEAVNILGNKCIKCGFSDRRALQIDHINGGGSQERKKVDFYGQFHKQVKESVEKNEGKYQLLCANCNWIKRFEKREYISKDF